MAADVPTLAPPARDGERTPPSSLMCEDGRLLSGPSYDGAVRWRNDERLEQLFEGQCDELRREGREDAPAVDGPEGIISYAELDARANQLARFLSRRQGIRPGDRIGLLFDRPLDGYIAMLAVLKLRAAYVPLDPGFPPGRLSYIVSDARVRMVLTRSTVDRGGESYNGVSSLRLDQEDQRIRAEDASRLADDEVGDPVDDLCYVIYTSGTTGRPKGVAICHASICNFVRVASEVYGVEATDRVYQGLTIAFDFSVEEIWVAWMAGATLVPKPAGESLIGAELHSFLTDHRITALCCVPTLLATLEEELPDLRFLLVSGESCPQDLVARWHRPGRRFLNVYGPTEATVSATWTVLHPDRPVTIGVPLPTYCIVILDPESSRTVPFGELGEIGIAGIGLADGYLNRPELTARSFITDFLSIPENPSGCIYRTGDLGLINADGEVEHRGRIDTQVKIRGYRVELAEIEAALRQVPGVAQAVVGTHRPEADIDELVAFYVPECDSEPPDEGLLYEHLRDQLPAYMVPAYLERLAELPLMASGKVDRLALPSPRGPRRLASRDGYVAPASDLEFLLADQLANTLGVERVSVDSHFFDDLGANSLLMAHFNAAVRNGVETLPPVSMRDVYRHPTVRRLAAALAESSPASTSTGWHERTELETLEPTGTPRYLLCGALQVLSFLAYACTLAVGIDVGSAWITAGHGLLTLYGRAAAVGAGTLLATGALPMIAKWVLIGRWKPQRIRVWSLAYFRFYLVKTLLIWNPLAHLFVGSPLYTLYLRALGAKIGRHALILTHHIPVCTDLIRIGAHAVIRQESFLNGYRARAGLIEIGPVEIGERAFLGERTVLDIYSRMQRDSQLGHSSSLHPGQLVPAGACWHGSPAEPAGAGHCYRMTTGHDPRPLREARYAAGRLLATFALVGPIEAALAALLLTHPRFLAPVSAVGALVIGAALVLGLLLTSLLFASVVPRLLTRLLEPGRTYPLYGIHYTIQRLILRASNRPSLNLLFGDSSAVVHYLRLLGYRFGVIEQTGSNFGTGFKQDVPALCAVGTGTMVSDGFSIMNAEFSSGSFRVMPVAIGKRNYLGNEIAFPPGARIGENCLLATKVLVPVGGAERRDVGLLGSPPFEIPRTVERDKRFEQLSTGAERQRRLAAKNRHNARTMGLHLLVRLLFTVSVVVIAVLPFGGSGLGDLPGTMGSGIADLVILVGLCLLIERAVTGFRPMRPRFCSIYERYFWQHERYWKVSSADAYLHLFDGTPLKALVWRALGARVGRRLFDDGCGITERLMVTIGDEVTLNRGAGLQCHSLEDGTFKSDYIVLGERCTLGIGALVHYDVVMDDDSIVETDSFLMKGSRLEPGARWGGNPAIELAPEIGSDIREPDSGASTELEAIA